jgi:transcriptional regulator with XRE-family HTH domain
MREYQVIAGKRVAQARKDRGLSGRAFAKLCDIDYSNLCRFEVGKRDIYLSTLVKIATALEMDVKDFL